jgi:predicted GTPase
MIFIYLFSSHRFKGVGKSSFINRTRKLSDNHAKAAKVGITDTTSLVFRYNWPDNPVIDFYDFPGYGLWSSIDEYKADLIDQHPCDFYVFIYAVRLQANDLDLIRYLWIKSNHLKDGHRKLVIARSKIDDTIKSLLVEESELSEQMALGKVKEAIVLDFANPRLQKFYDNDFKKEDLKVFMISTSRENVFKYELKDLLSEIVNSLPDAYAESFALHCIDLGKIWIENKRAIFEKRITKLAIISGVSDLIPVGGVLIDIGIIYREVRNYLESFGLTAEKLQEYGKILELPPAVTNSIIDAVGVRSMEIHIKNSIATAMTGLSIGVTATTITKVASGTAGLAFGMVTFGVGFVVQAAITGPISYYLTKKVLKRILYDTEKDAHKIFQELTRAALTK